MFSGKWISIIIEKKLKFQLTFAKGRKKVWKRRGPLSLNSYNSWTEWDIFTKLRTHVYDIVFWSNKKNWPDSPLGGAYKIGKTVTHNRLVWLTWNLVYSISVQRGTKGYKDICISQKHGRHWPYNFKHLLDKVSRGQSKGNSMGMFHSLF